MTVEAKQIAGYTDKISLRAGETIQCMVSSEHGQPYRARLVRIVHGDANPAGPGVKFEPVEGVQLGEFPGRRQEIHCGSYVTIPASSDFAVSAGLTLQAFIWPTTPGSHRQTLLAQRSTDDHRGYELFLDDAGALALELQDNEGKAATVATETPLRARQWYFVGASYDAATGNVHVYQEPVSRFAADAGSAQVDSEVQLGGLGDVDTPFLLAARARAVADARVLTRDHFNGKIDRPRVARRALTRIAMSELAEADVRAALKADVVAAWDFSQEIGTDRVRDVAPRRHDGETVNLPARAVTGFNWDGSELNWRHAPAQYGAIHFHDDDLYDAGWEADFDVRIPGDVRSGLYAIHVQTEASEDYLPFAVRPAEGGPTARVALLIPTASYMAYANEHQSTDAPLAQLVTGRVPVLHPEDLFNHEHREYGASLYDTHSDGSGVCYSSRLRPILNMRPKYHSWLGGAGSSLWQFNADTHITDWLEAMGHEYDVLTDEDLHYEGVHAIEPYRVLLTGTHPEYWSVEMWDALDAWKHQGGRLMYLGANGWYWRIDYHPDLPGVIEVRRGEGGIRAWAAEPGEYYHSFSGGYGGLWRRQGRPPQLVAGTGFTAQGFDLSSYYRRRPDSFEPRAEFIFEGIGEDELVGDFGLVGGGAAGLELDRYDPLLGSPPNALWLASSEGHTDIYVLVPEDVLVPYPGIVGGQHELIRADLVFYETPAGGAVFATSSIAWAGSLSHNNYDNNVSRITNNVLVRFMDEKPFVSGA